MLTDTTTPFVQACLSNGCTLTHANNSLQLHKDGDTVVFYGPSKEFDALMAQKRYYKLLKKMLYLASLGVTPVFSVERPWMWSDQMLGLECERMMDPKIMLHRFFAVPHKMATPKMQEGPNVLMCGFKPVGIRYSHEKNAGNYGLELTLAHSTYFFRHVYTEEEIAYFFDMPLDVLHWLGDTGSSAWWKGLNEQAIRARTKLVELGLVDFEFG